jgi:hypothetical protein
MSERMLEELRYSQRLKDVCVRLGMMYDTEYLLLEQGVDRLYTRQEMITFISKMLGVCFSDYTGKITWMPTISSSCTKGEDKK